jgi:hypothetical protein
MSGFSGGSSRSQHSLSTPTCPWLQCCCSTTPESRFRPSPRIVNLSRMARGSDTSRRFPSRGSGGSRVRGHSSLFRGMVVPTGRRRPARDQHAAQDHPCKVWCGSSPAPRRETMLKDRSSIFHRCSTGRFPAACRRRWSDRTRNSPFPPRSQIADRRVTMAPFTRQGSNLGPAD